MGKKSNLNEYTFTLFAPNNNKAKLIADFNDWKEVPMEKSTDGYFRLTVKLADGEYQYKFAVQTKSWFYEEDEWKTFTDPYATDVDPPTQNSILKIKNGEKIVDEYVWQHDDVALPQNHALVIYEMHVADFSGGEDDGYNRGKYADVIAKLNYLEELGVNALELMPLKESPGDFNWGYSPIHYFSPDNNYGSTAELKEMIDKCHALGMRIIVDGVYNHASTENPLTQIDHDYWFRHEGKDPEQNWGPEFDYEKTDERFDIRPAKRFINDSIRYWIHEYRIDGVRFDAAKQIGNFEALESFVYNSREMSKEKPFFTVAEFIPPSPEITEPFGPVESCWNDSFMYAMVEYLSGEEANLEKLKNAINPLRLGFKGATSVTNYLANHDQNRLLRKLGEKGILGDEAFLRAKLGALILLTAVGVPMIWMGEEFGEYVPMSEASNKINWTLLESNASKNLHDYYKTLIKLRTTNSAFHAPNIRFFFEDEKTKVLAFERFDDSGNVAVVIVNFSDDDLENFAVKDFPDGENWHEWTKDYEQEIKEKTLTVSLPRREGLIFVKQ